MTISKERKFLILSSLALVIIILIAISILDRNDHDTIGDGPVAHIRCMDSTSIPVTPDSNRADPLEAETTRFTTITIGVTLEEPLKPGGRIRIEQGYLFHEKALTGENVRYAFPDPILEDGTAPNFLSVESKGSPLKVTLISASLGRFSPQVEFPEGLPAGREVIFRHGDTSMGSPGLAVPTYPLKIRFLTFVDLSGQGEYTLASGNHPEVEVFASGADRFQVYGPSVTYGKTITVRIIPVRGTPGLESSSLPVRDYHGRVEILDGHTSLASVVFQKGDRFKDVTATLPSSGLFRLTAVSDDGLVKGESNPVLYPEDSKENVSDFPGSPLRASQFFEGRAIFWGSLQNHTAIGGHAAGLPDEAFRCAREEGALDFCALTDHSSNPSFHWEELRELPDRFDEPGRFVAFAGYEWTSATYGHRHVILKEGKDSFACSEAPTSGPFEKYAPDLHTFSKWAGCDPNVILIPHHTRRVLDSTVSIYNFGNPMYLSRQLLFEVFSWQGSSEGTADDLLISGRKERTLGPRSGYRDTLSLGYRMGITSDSDQHMGLPGVPVSIRRKNGLRYGLSGLTAVMSVRLDRDGIFGALERRHCYGTTGARILLFFEAGGRWMGNQTGTSDSHVRIRARAWGTAPITRIRIIADGYRIIHEVQPNALEALVDFETPIPKVAPSQYFHSYYLRLDQADGHRAWSSPVWVKNRQ